MKQRLIGIIGSALIGLLIGGAIVLRSDIPRAPVVLPPTPTIAPVAAQTWYIKSDEPVAAYDCPDIDCNMVMTLLGGTAVSLIGPAQGEAMLPVSSGGQVIFIKDTWLSPKPTTVERPGIVPRGATAKCKDGWISQSQNHRGTCSHHHGVATWY